MKEISGYLLEISMSILGVLSSGALLLVLADLCLNNTMYEIRYEIRTNNLLKAILIVCPLVICFVTLYYLRIIKFS